MTQAVEKAETPSLPERITVRIGRIYEYKTSDLLQREDLREGEPTLERLLAAANRAGMEDYDAEVDFFTENIEDFVSPRAFITHDGSQSIDYQYVGINLGQIRCVNFRDYNPEDPFVIGHANPAMLEDSVLNAFYAAFSEQKTTKSAEVEEIEEDFFAYLKKFDYFSIVVSDAQLVFPARQIN